MQPSLKSIHIGDIHFYYRTIHQRQRVEYLIANATFQHYINSDMTGEEWAEGMRDYLKQANAELPVIADLTFKKVSVYSKFI